MIRTMHGLEWKYVVPRSLADAFLEAIEPYTRAEIHDGARPVSYARTTYLDTSDGRFLRSTAPCRRLRVREYAAASWLGAPITLTGESWIELKASGSGSRTKLCVRAPGALLSEMIATHGTVHVDWERSYAFDAIRTALADAKPSPCLTTWYRRESRVADGLRVTVDSGLSASFPESLGAAGDPAKPARIVDRLLSRVLEIKHSGSPAPWLVDAMTLLPRPSDFSKFRWGMEALARAGTLREVKRT